jgi:NAD(P)H-hydrate epimerase
VSAEAPRSAVPSPRHGYTAAQVRAAEAPLLAAGQPLMRRAAAALADEIERLVARATDGAGRPLVVVLAGSGDNGGDALFAGAHLAERGADVRVVAVGSRLHEAGADAARRAGAIDLDPDADAADFVAAIDAADVVVDGILGIGAAASPALRGRSREIVARVLERFAERGHAERPPGTRHPLVVAVDLPSGISPDDGRVPDPTVLPADLTVTMGAVKAGLLLPPGSRFAGRVVLVDLGLGPALADVDPVVTV